mmetsp:Transcript_24955/g.41122  ORF Transcript_24955/g.41122 Transcript_24955/m.41122 type:complete len:242 (+) Transcript_24955:74-799(+)
MFSMEGARIVILTGAGISAESGLQTFRDLNGLWQNHPVEDLASPEGFQRNPKLVQTFYSARRAQLQAPEIKPNAAHYALAELERHFPRGEVLVVTQNVDDLHERAGTTQLIHMHGELLKARCISSKQIYHWTDPIDTDQTLCPCCKRRSLLRPHIVWFGETPFHMDEIESALEQCEIFASIGTSGNVYPAAGFVTSVQDTAKTIELNLDKSMISSDFQEHRLGSATVTVPIFVKELIEHWQ